MLSEEEKKAIRNLENLSEYGLSTTLNQADLDKMKTVLNIITKTIIIAKKQNKHPINVDITNGVVENAIIPSIEYKNNFQNDHVVFTATLSTFSYSNHFVSKPTQPNIPFENLLYSPRDIILSVICLVINLKSLAPSTILAFEILLIIL